MNLKENPSKMSPRKFWLFIALLIACCITLSRFDTSTPIPQKEYAYDLSTEIGVSKYVTGTWINTNSFSDAIIRFNPNGKGGVRIYKNNRTNTVEETEYFDTWYIKKGYFLKERKEFFYIITNSSSLFYIPRRDGNIFSPYNSESYYSTSEGVQFFERWNVDREHPEGSIYIKQ